MTARIIQADDQPFRTGTGDLVPPVTATLRANGLAGPGLPARVQPQRRAPAAKAAA